jgi:hypothetical protein
MKTLCIGLLMGLFIPCITGCSSTVNYAEASKVIDLVEHDNYTFVATKAYPMDQATMNILGSLRPTGSGWGILNLDYVYGFSLEHTLIKVDLPYFGRAFSPTIDPSKNSVKFKSKNISILKKKNKNRYSVTLQIHDVQNIQTMYLDIFNNGKARLSINFTDRQPISYDGYIDKGL